jgi:hypothetical protein
VIDNYDGELAAQMRLAFTRATIAFPRKLNMSPVVIAVYHVFQDVYFQLRRDNRAAVPRRFDPFEPSVMGHITDLVDHAEDELRCKNIPVEVTRGMPALEAKRCGGLVAGLDRGAAIELVSFIKNTANDSESVKRRRAFLLVTRRNLLANNLTRDAAARARSYYLSEAGYAEPDAG